jgi:gluconolactonase
MQETTIRARMGVGLALVTAGCMTGSTVQSIASQAEPVTLQGYAISGSHEVRVECKPVGAHGLTSLGTTTSAGSAALTENGGSIHAWTKSVVIPAACWVPMAPGVAGTRVYATDVDEGVRMVHVRDLACAWAEIADGATPASAGFGCAERFAYRELRAPSGLPALIDPLAGMGQVQLLASGFGWAEGPLWDADDQSLVFTDIAADQIHRLTDGVLSTEVGPAGTFTNGLDYDAQGSRLECQHATQRVVRRAPDGAVTVLAATYQGVPFNSPNDAIAHVSGTIFFTDPTYGSLPGLGAAVPLQPHRGVYRVALDTSVVTLVDDALTQPNGIALAPDHATLYVSDTEGGVVMQYPVTAGGTTGVGSLLANVAAPDGLAVDVDGNLYVTGSAGVVVLQPDGTPWGTIALPATPTNVAFGGVDRRALHVTTPDAVYRVVLGVPGLPASF